MAEGLEGRELMSYGGSPDLSFGTLGFAPYGVDAGSSFVAEASAGQADGKVVVVGYVTTFPASGVGNGQYLAAARYNTNGTLDSTFGPGGYFTSTTLSTLAGSGSSSNNTFMFKAVAFQPNGDIVLAGATGNIGRVVRLTPDGALDSTFGTGGIVTLGDSTAHDGKVDYGASVAVLPDGNIAVGGPTATTSQLFPAVAELNADGSVDTSFGTSGTAVVPVPTGYFGYNGSSSDNSSGLIAQPDGKVVIVADVLGTTTGAVVTTRYNADGTLDTTFGAGGQSVVSKASDPAIGFEISATTVAIQADGKLVIGGTSFGNGLAALRLNVDGTPDTTFGIGGADILGGLASFANASAVLVQADGKILLADEYNPDVIRLNSNGLPDPSFGEAGVARFPVSASQPLYNGLVGLSVLPSGVILGTQMQSSTVYGPNGFIALVSKGAPGDYDHDGISDPAVLDTTTATFLDAPSGGRTAQSTPIGDPGAPFTLPAPGAYDGGGISEVAVYRPGSGTFDVKPYAGGPDVITAFGTPGLGNALPAPGDYDGSGKTELAVYSPAQGEFIYRPAGSNGNQDRVVPFGLAGAGQSIPAPADYFGTGVTDFAVYLVAQGAYEIRNPVTGEDYTIPFGTPGAGQSIPVPGDYDGSGHIELAVYVPASGDLIYRPASGGADVIVPFGTPGIATTIPAPGDYDGSGHTEVAGYETTTGMFSYLPAAGGAAVSIALGTAGETVPFSMGTNAVAESGIGSSSGSADALASVEIPLTPDVLDSLAGTAAKKTAKTS